VPKNWDETTWIETLADLIAMFEDFTEAERWIRKEVLHEL